MERDKGKTGKILRAMPKENLVVVEGLNLQKEASKPTSKDKKGQLIEVASPMHASNVKNYIAQIIKVIAMKHNTAKQNKQVYLKL